VFANSDSRETARCIFAPLGVENRGRTASVLDQNKRCRYPNTWLVAEQASGDKTMKGAILIAAAVTAIALGACRREEAVPMKLGAEVPASTEVAR
jgi:hypothetical protein